MGLQYSSVVSAPVAEVFAWHERPGALPRLAPAVATAQGCAGGVVPGRRPGDPAAAWTGALGRAALRRRPAAAGSSTSWSRCRCTGVTRTVSRRSGTGQPGSIDDVDTPVPGSLLLQTFRYRHQQLAEDLAAHQSMDRAAA